MSSLVADSTSDVQIFEYSRAVNPIASGSVPEIPYREFSAALYASGESRIVPLDLSAELRCPYPATTPGLLASFVRIHAGERLATSPRATGEFYYVIRGRGRTETAGGAIPWKTGDFFILPGIPAEHHADDDAAFYLVTDSPLLAYLGVERSEARFRPTLYSREAVMRELENAKADPHASQRSRISVLLANRNFEQTMTITHVLWTMFGIIPPGARQMPHRHQSAAVDYVVEAGPNVYTLVGAALNPDGTIQNPVRADWHTGSAFVTPPGYWHEHRNESGADAFIMPIQDAGLHTYLRTLDIQFYSKH
ncbi:MAG: cupin [Acidobacteriaceae bacterium]